jgi:hypothetical protein
VIRIPTDAVIDETKFTNYLLVTRPWDDKSDFLRQAGFELQNWPDLLTAVRRLADEVDAAEDRTNDYGTFFRVEGVLEGPTGGLSVVCIWMRQAIDGTFRVVTLKPAKRRRGNGSSTV